MSGKRLKGKVTKPNRKKGFNGGGGQKNGKVPANKQKFPKARMSKKLVGKKKGGQKMAKAERLVEVFGTFDVESEASTNLRDCMTIVASPDTNAPNNVFSAWASQFHHLFGSSGSNRELEAVGLLFQVLIYSPSAAALGLNMFPRFLLDIIAAVQPKVVRHQGVCYRFSLNRLTWSQPAAAAYLSNAPVVRSWTSESASRPAYGGVATTWNQFTNIDAINTFLSKYSAEFDCVSVLHYRSKYLRDPSAFAFFSYSGRPMPLSFSSSDFLTAGGYLNENSTNAFPVNRPLSLEVPIFTPWLACLGFGGTSTNRDPKYSVHVLSTPGGAVWARMRARAMGGKEGKVLAAHAHRVRVKLVNEQDILGRFMNLIFMYVSKIGVTWPAGGGSVAGKTPWSGSDCTCAMFCHWWMHLCGLVNARCPGVAAGAIFRCWDGTQVQDLVSYPVQVGVAPMQVDPYANETIEWIVHQFSRLVPFEVRCEKNNKCQIQAIEVPLIGTPGANTWTSPVWSDLIDTIWFDDANKSPFIDGDATKPTANDVKNWIVLWLANSHPYQVIDIQKHFRSVEVGLLSMGDRCRLAAWPRTVSSAMSLTPYTLFAPRYLKDASVKTALLPNLLTWASGAAFDPTDLIELYAIPCETMSAANAANLPLGWMSCTGEDMIQNLNQLSNPTASSPSMSFYWDLMERIVYPTSIIPSQLRIGEAGVTNMASGIKAPGLPAPVPTNTNSKWEPKVGTGSGVLTNIISGGSISSTTVDFSDVFPQFTTPTGDVPQKSFSPTTTGIHDITPYMTPEDLRTFRSNLERPSQGGKTDSMLKKLLEPLIPTKGNYCGPGWSAGTRLPPKLGAGETWSVQPTGVEDAICKAHDTLYAKARDVNDILDADGIMVNQLRRVAQNQTLSNYGNAMLLYFSSKLRTLRPWAYEDYFSTPF